MQWIPDTIRALTEAYATAGLGAVAFVGVVGLLILLWRHLGGILNIMSAILTHKAPEDPTKTPYIITLGESIQKTNSAILDETKEVKKFAEATASRVDKLPSDRVECKAQTDEQLLAVLKKAFDKSGFILSDAEIQMLLKHRQEVHDAAAQVAAELAAKTADMPIRPDKKG